MRRQSTIVAEVADALRLTYRTPAQTVRAMLPEGLELVERGPWAFWDVLFERIEHARPAGVPAFCGVGFVRVSYRLRAQAMNDRAEVVRGGYETRCELSKRTAIYWLGSNPGTQPNLARMAWDADDCGLRLDVCHSTDAHGDVKVHAAHAPAHRHPGSCFPTASDAARFNAEPPDCLQRVDCDGRPSLVVYRQENATTACVRTPVSLPCVRLSYFESIGQDQHVALEWASRVGPIACRWAMHGMGALLQPKIIATPAPVAS